LKGILIQVEENLAQGIGRVVPIHQFHAAIDALGCIVEAGPDLVMHILLPITRSGDAVFPIVLVISPAIAVFYLPAQHAILCGEAMHH
jgi:hypothetical protein